MKNNEAIDSFSRFKTSVEQATEYIENFDILETINNVGNDEVFTPLKICNQMLDILPIDVWINPNLKWLNPVDKNGVFLREIAIRLDKGLEEWEPITLKRRKHILKNMLFSIGLTRFTAQVSRRTVYYCSKANKFFDGKLDDNQSPVNGYAIGNGSWFSNEEGNIITPDAEHSFVNGKCQFCGINQNSKYTDKNQVEHYAYQFIHELDLQKFLSKRFNKGEEKMNFDIIIGNPPYQLSDGGGTGDSAKPIYQLFVEQAKLLNPKFLCFIIPSRWMKGGKGLDNFRENMINDNRIQIIHDYESSKEVFPSVNLDGGVCYFLWNSNHNGPVSYTTHSISGEIMNSTRFLKSQFTNKVIRDSRQLSIIDKVSNKGLQKFDTIVSKQKPYGFRADFFNKPEKYNVKNIKEAFFSGSVKIYGVKGKKGGAKRTFAYIPKSNITKNLENLSKYKLFFSKAFMFTSTVPPEIILGEPETLCTETFLEIGPFPNQKTALYYLNYIKTKFFRALFFFNRHSLNISQDSFSLIPLMDEKHLKELNDHFLYNFFGLDQTEIDFIENLIKPME